MLERELAHAGDLRSRVFWRQSGRTNIGYAIPGRIHHADPRPPRNIGAERVGGLVKVKVTEAHEYDVVGKIV